MPPVAAFVAASIRPNAPVPSPIPPETNVAELVTGDVYQWGSLMAGSQPVRCATVGKVGDRVARRLRAPALLVFVDETPFQPEFGVAIAIVEAFTDALVIGDE